MAFWSDLIALNTEMPQIRKYPSTNGHRKFSVFPPDVQDALKSLGDDIYTEKEISILLAKFRSELSNISPCTFRAALSDIRAHAQLYYRRDDFRYVPAWNFVARMIENPKTNIRLKNFYRNLEIQEDLPFLLLFDGDGRNRELALAKIQEGLKSPMEVLCLADLANNWVEQVRKAAIRAIERSYPKTEPSIMAASFAFLAENRVFWKRWDEKSSDYVMSFFHHSPVQAELVRRLKTGLEPRSTKALSYALESDSLDEHLESIFANSRDSSVRAKALATMLNREAVWAEGFTWQWTNKALGERKRVRSLGKRKLTVTPSRTELVSTALGDKSARVRCIAAQALIDFGDELKVPVKRAAQRLVDDRSPRVVRRGEFLLRKLQLAEKA